MKLPLFCILACLVANAAPAQSLGDKLVGGLKKGAQTVGEGAATVADAVEGSVETTTELFSSDKNPSDTRARLAATANQSLARLFEEQPDTRGLLERSAGYAVFDVRKATLAGFSGSAGRGVAVDRANDRRIYMNMTTAGVGLALGIGGFESQLVILFEDASDFDKFITQGFDASANAGSMVGDDRTDIEIEFRDGRAVFVLTTRGWRVGASATGSTFWPDEDLN